MSHTFLLLQKNHYFVCKPFLAVTTKEKAEASVIISIDFETEGVELLKSRFQNNCILKKEK